MPRMYEAGPDNLRQINDIEFPKVKQPLRALSDEGGAERFDHAKGVITGSYQQGLAEISKLRVKQAKDGLNDSELDRLDDLERHLLH